MTTMMRRNPLPPDQLAAATKKTTKKRGTREAGRGEFAENGQADLFVVPDVGVEEAAKVWLARRGVIDRHVPVYLAALMDRDDSPASIRLPQWQTRVRSLEEEFFAAGFVRCFDATSHFGRNFPAQGLWSSVTILLEIIDGSGVALRPGPGDSRAFEELISDTGYRHELYADGLPEAEVLVRDIERMIKVDAQNRKTKKKQADLVAAGKTAKGKACLSTPPAKARQDLDRELDQFVEQRTGQKDVIAKTRTQAEAKPIDEQIAEVETPFGARPIMKSGGAHEYTVPAPHSKEAEREIDLAKIVDSPFQLRDHQEDLDGLKDTLVSHGLLQAVVVRPIAGGRFELLAGHRRCAAARLAGWKTIRARIQEADDSQAQEIVVIENLLRRDLSPIEEAHGFQSLLSRPNTTQESLAARLGISQPQISNRLRLLRLPKPVQEAVISGEISASTARELVKVADLPAVMDKILGDFKRTRKYRKTATMADILEDSGGIEAFVDEATCAVAGTRWVSALNRQCEVFKPTPEQREQLDIREFSTRWGDHGMKEERACNTKLWEELQKAHEAALIARAKKRGDKNSDKSTGEKRQLSKEELQQLEAEERQRKEKMQKQLRRRREELIVDRLRHLIALRILQSSTTESELLEMATRAALRGWGHSHQDDHVSKSLSKIKAAPIRERAARMTAEIFWDGSAEMPSRIVYAPDQVRDVAAFLQIDGEAAWKVDQLGPLTEAWWGAYSASELRALCETHCLGSQADGAYKDLKKSRCIELLAAADGLPSPTGLNPKPKKSGKRGNHG